MKTTGQFLFHSRGSRGRQKVEHWTELLFASETLGLSQQRLRVLNLDQSCRVDFFDHVIFSQSARVTTPGLTQQKVTARISSTALFHLCLQSHTPLWQEMTECVCTYCKMSVMYIHKAHQGENHRLPFCLMSNTNDFPPISNLFFFIPVCFSPYY